MKCTWKGCTAEGAHEQNDQGGKAWAKLCDAHAAELEDTIAGPAFSPVKILRAWVLAGGAEAAAKRTLGQ